MSICGSKLFGSSRGTVILVALCFVAVLGVMLAGYLALCSRVMGLSNRGFQRDLGRQLAEAGIEEALRAFNKNDWSDWSATGISVDWTLDAANKRATATLTYASNKFAQGTTASVKIRVDNYDTHVLGATWSSSRTYQPNEVVGYNGIWYSCIRAHSNQSPPNLNYWVPEGIPWRWDANTTYAVEDLIVYDGVWYRCTTSNTGHPPPSYSSEWKALVAIYTSVPAWPYVSSGEEALLFDSGGLVQLTNSTWGTNPPYAWRWRDAQSYEFNDVVYYNSSWYRCVATHTSSWWPNNTSNTSYWVSLSNPWNWSSSINYNIGDVVYHGGSSRWYRCIRKHSNQTPSTTSAYWADTPLLSNQWMSAVQYSANDVTIYNGVWYLCILSHTSSTSITPTNTTYWIGADTTNAGYIWNVSTAYAANSYRCYGGLWYKCIATTTANAGHTPNNTSYWTAAWSQSSGVTTGAPVVYAESTLTLGDSTTSKTQLRATIDPAPLFPNAAGATTTLTISSGSGTVDSYDNSLGTTYASQVGTSTNYSAVLAAGTGSAAGTSTLLSIGGSTLVRSYAAAPSSSTTPYAPRASFGSSVVIQNASSPVSPNVDLSKVSRSPYIPAFDAQPTPLSTAFSSWNFPYGRALPTSGTPLTNNTLNLGTPGGTTPTRYYYNGSLNIGSSYYIGTLNINGPVVLYINGTLRTRTGGTLNVNTPGSAIIMADGGIRTDAGTGGFNNRTLDPKKLFLISDITGTTTHYLAATTNPFYGVIYIPNTTATLGLDIRTGVSVYGALSAREITFSTEANLHYDTSLRHATFSGVDQPYTVTTWSELAATEQATMP